MKNIILLIAVMVLSACASMPTMKSVAGTYEIKVDGDTFRLVLLENGNRKLYLNGKKQEGEHKWKISKEGELHITNPDGGIVISRINKDGSITAIAFIYKDGEREEVGKEEQFTYKKIK